MPSDDGTVPEFEAREAAIYCNYNWLQWRNDLDSSERAKCVAQYREHYRIEANVSDASEKAATGANRIRNA